MALDVDAPRARPDRDELLPRPGREARAKPWSSIRAGTRPRSASSSARRGARASRSSSPTGTGTISAASPTSPRATGAPVYMAEDERVLLERVERLHAAGLDVRGRTGRTCSSGGDETLELAGIAFETCACRATLRDTSPMPRTERSSPATCCSPAAVGRADLPGADWDSSWRRSERSPSAIRRRPRVSGPRPARRRSAPSSRTNPFLAELRAPRDGSRRRRGTHDILPAEQPLWQLVTGTMERLCASRTATADPDAGLRGHRALRAHVGPGLRRRPEGDVHVRGPRRPLADAATGGDGADLPRLPRARDAPRAAAGEALHDRADVPVRRAPAGPLPRALAAVARGDRLVRSGDRRRGDPALPHAARDARRDDVRAPAELDRRRRPAGPRTSRSSNAWLDANARRARRRGPAEARDEPAARLRREEARACARRSPTRRRSASRCAPTARAHFDEVRRYLDAYGVAVRDRADARARARLLHAHDLGVRRPGRGRPGGNDLAAAAATTA